MLLLICSILLTICIIKWMYRDKTLYAFADQIPGPKAFPIIGSSHKILKKSEEDRFKIVQDMLAKYETNEMTRFWLGPVLFIFINEPKLIQQVLNSNDCLEKSFNYKFLRLDKGLLAAKRETWVDHRKFLEDSFRLDVIKSFISIFVDSSNQLVASLSQTKEQDETKIDIFKLVSRSSLTMVLATSFGINASEVHFDDEILKAVEELIKIISLRCHEPVLYFEPIYRMTRNYYREKKYRKRTTYYLDQVLKERRELISPNNNLTTASSVATMRTDITKDEEMGITVQEIPNISLNSHSFIDHMVMQSGAFNDEEIHDHIYTFVAAGYETVALQTFFTLLLLAIHTDMQERVHCEVVNVGDINCESLDKLNYLDRVIKESMRLLPSVPIVGRETREEVVIGDKKIPKGITLLIHLFNLHRRKDIWGDDAHEFNPDRFLPENVAQRHSHSFLPFSEGLRDCIGKVYAMYAIKTMLVTILRKFKVSTDLKFGELSYKADITLKICQNTKIKIEKR
ncbi:hypothetical protein PVAND_011039 [Polypedilum vanderplanki]|uniref:Cytochrome P450 n=1 Tax=Polypedilum vanderplanki TaxID=319348 RepID=A0A9J6CID5_POLVA|nr:hypothetical protein PVAND_011039 [Polypedilum vanderplanki]